MKKEEYLRKALLLVSNPYTKAQVQRELEDHIEDEISFYTDAGHEREKAENMAMSRMGAPEEMARELGRLHLNLPGRMLGFSALAACVLLSVLYGFCDQWSYSLYDIMPDWLVYTLLFGNVLAVLAATALAFRWAWKCKDPVLLVGHGLNDVRIFYTRHAHVPFQSVGLCRLRQVGRTDIGSVHAGITYKDVSLGMEAFDVGLIRNMNFRMR
jgi:hypothetical protein